MLWSGEKLPTRWHKDPAGKCGAWLLWLLDCGIANGIWSRIVCIAIEGGSDVETLKWRIIARCAVWSCWTSRLRRARRGLRDGASCRYWRFVSVWHLCSSPARSGCAVCPDAAAQRTLCGATLSKAAATKYSTGQPERTGAVVMLMLKRIWVG